MNILLAHLLILGLPGSVVFALICWSTGGRRIWLSIISGTAATLSIYLFSIFWFGGPVAQVKIKVPPDLLATNRSWITIEGTVSPPDARVHVLVHPNQDLYWWVQQEATKGIQGAWRAEVSLGIPENGKGTHFQVVAVASTNSIIFDVICNLGLAEGDQLERPPALPSTDMITIWREQ